MCKKIGLVILAIILTPLGARGATSVSILPGAFLSLTYNGRSYAGQAQICFIQKMTFAQAGNQYTPTMQRGAPAVRGGLNAVSITRTYRWGTLTCTYSASGDQLRAQVVVANRTPSVITDVTLGLLYLARAQGKLGGGMYGTERGLGGPEIGIIPYGETNLFVANQEVPQPLTIVTAPSAPGVGLFLESGVIPPKPLSPVLRPIAPGGSLTLSLLFRFADSAAPLNTVMVDLIQRWVARFPNHLNWPDRRPIGMMMLASHAQNMALNPRNPRYWFFANPNIDINSEQGRAAFRASLLKLADGAVQHLKSINAQGIVIWDIEGQQYLQPRISYVGDPRFLPPEMQNGVAQEFFKRFTDAGFRCGVTLRAEQLSSPVGQPIPPQAYQMYSDNPDTVFNWLDAKVGYVEQRFGCTLFYVDSNGGPFWPFDFRIFERLHAKYPNALFMPEHKNLLYYSVSAPYCDARNEKNLCPSADARWMYPSAFSVIDVTSAHLGAQPPNHMDLQRRADSGDVLMTESMRSLIHEQHTQFVVESMRKAAMRRRSNQ